MAKQWTRQEKIRLLGEKMVDQEWRKNAWVLFRIKDKDANVIPFIPNKYQLWLNEEAHSFNIILKARQIWFTTYIDVAILLEYALFTPNVKVWIIAQDKFAVWEIFEDKVKFAYDNLPQFVKDKIECDTSNANKLTFSNGSSIAVATSFRSGTLQMLHISELWPIAFKYPKKAREIINWAMPAVSQGGKIFVESTAEGKIGKFYELCMQAMKLQDQWKILNPKEPKFFFVSWWENEWYTLDDPYMELTDVTVRYFKELSEKLKREFTEGQMKWYQSTKELLRWDMQKEFPSYPMEAFSVSIKWAYFNEQVELVYKEKRECMFPYEPTLRTFVVLDIWVSDAMSVMVYQVYGLEVRLVKWFNVSNFDMQKVHLQLLQPLWWNIDMLFLPHDGAVRSANDGQTREETLRKLWYETFIMPAMNVDDSIDLAISIFPRVWFHKTNTVVEWDGIDYTLLDMLSAYREKTDPRSGLGMGVPLHDEASHPADAFRYLCQSLDYIKRILDDFNTPWATYSSGDDDLV